MLGKGAFGELFVVSIADPEPNSGNEERINKSALFSLLDEDARKKLLKNILLYLKGDDDDKGGKGAKGGKGGKGGGHHHTLEEFKLGLKI